MHTIITGRVTGVGFRFTTREIAKKLGVRGFVQNIAGENVEIIAEAEEKKLTELKNQLRQTFADNIVNFETNFEDPIGNFTDFSIKRGPVKD